MYLKQNQTPGNKTIKNGFTLVEILVAAAILVIVIVAAITALRKGAELEVSDNHRRAARALATSVLERNFNYSQYYLVNAGTVVYPNDTIDLRNGTAPLRADVVRSVVVLDTLRNVSGKNIPVQKVTVTVKWQEPGSGVDSILVEKWLADPK